MADSAGSDSWLDYAKRLIADGPIDDYVRGHLGDARWDFYVTGRGRPRYQRDGCWRFVYYAAAGPLPDPVPFRRSRTVDDLRRVLLCKYALSPVEVFAHQLLPVWYHAADTYLHGVAALTRDPLDLARADRSRAVRVEPDRIRFYHRDDPQPQGQLEGGPMGELARIAWYMGYVLYEPGIVEQMQPWGQT